MSRKLLNPMVPAVGDVQVPLAVQHQPVRRVEPPRSGARLKFQVPPRNLPAGENNCTRLFVALTQTRPWASTHTATGPGRFLGLPPKPPGPVSLSPNGSSGLPTGLNFWTAPAPPPSCT